MIPFHDVFKKLNIILYDIVIVTDDLYILESRTFSSFRTQHIHIKDHNSCCLEALTVGAGIRAPCLDYLADG